MHKISGVLLLCLLINYLAKAQEKKELFIGFAPPTSEHQCIRAFNDTAAGVNNVNAFLLAKMTELMYLERLDFHLNYIHNDKQTTDSIPSSDWIKANSSVNNDNFEKAFVQRFSHYFDAPLESKEEHQQHQGNSDEADHTQFRFIKKTYTEKEKFLGFHYQNGLDPELMVISTPDLILILFRGTDNVDEDKWAEWTGTDLRIHQTKAGGALSGSKLHTGFWLSFDLIRDELIATLAEFEAENKKIWIAGHSLGAALSVVTGVYLKSYGLNVQNVYAFACPRTIGNKKFIKKANILLPNRIQRFEYYQDPVTLLWAPGFKYFHVGQRNWYDNEDEKYTFYRNTHERVFITAPLKKYPNIKVADKKKAFKIKQKQMNGTVLLTKNMLHYHNPQWYVKAAYQQLTDEEKTKLPKIDETYPYLYYDRKGAK